MTISFDNCAIPAGETGELGGAVFNLMAPPQIDAEFEAPTEERVVLTANSIGVVVSNLDASDYENAWHKGLIAAQQALDVFSARGLADLRLEEPQYDHLAVYGEHGGQVLRLVGVSTVTFNMKVTAEVINQAGEIVPQAPPISVWHESMRYYRQAQLTDDLFESFRNLWLAFENLLDSLEPAVPQEREKTWLKRALGKADTAIELKRFLPPGFKGKPVNAAYKYFYDEMRTHLFHAKASRQPLLPYEAAGTNLLVSRHSLLTSLYLNLLEHVTEVARPSGALTATAFDRIMDGLEKDAAILATDDLERQDPDETRINPAGGKVIETQPTRAKSLERPFLGMFLGRITGADVAPIDRVRKTAYTSNGNLISAHIVEGDLRVSGLSALEVQMGLRIRSGGLPKSFAEM